MTRANIFLLSLIFIQIPSLVLSQNQSTICESGKSQSPIFVDLYQTKYVTYPSFVFSTGYRQSMIFQVSNRQNQTISIIPILHSPKTLLVKGGSLSGIFTFQSAHLHWPQSEHRFSKKNYTAEAHFIHKNLDTNETAVFAYFFTLADSQAEGNNSQMNSWEFVLQRSINNTNMIIVGGLSSLMKGDKDQFVHYTGSLTTPPCTEGIHWILVSSAIQIRETYLNRLRTNVITSNYRATQSLNGRIVRRSFLSTSWNN